MQQLVFSPTNNARTAGVEAWGLLMIVLQKVAPSKVYPETLYSRHHQWQLIPEGLPSELGRLSLGGFFATGDDADPPRTRLPKPS